MSLAGVRFLARRCPAWRWHEPDLRDLCGTGEGVRPCRACAGGPARSSGEVPV